MADERTVNKEATVGTNDAIVVCPYDLPRTIVLLLDNGRKREYSLQYTKGSGGLILNRIH